MRLSTEEIEHIISVLNTHLKLSNAELRLFGSRTNDKARGGDIDLLLIFTDTACYEQALEKKLMILVNLKEKLGDQKIDLITTTADEIPADPFLDMIYDTSILLHKWH